MIQPIPIPPSIPALVDLLKANGFVEAQLSEGTAAGDEELELSGPAALVCDLPNGRTVLVTQGMGGLAPDTDENGVYAGLCDAEGEVLEDAGDLADGHDTPVADQIRGVVEALLFWGIALRPPRP